MEQYTILIRKEVDKPKPSIPDSFLALVRELNALGLDFSMRKFENGFNSTTNMYDSERDIFIELENRLMLRALLSRKKTEQFAKYTSGIDENNLLESTKFNEQKKLLEKLEDSDLFK